MNIVDSILTYPGFVFALISTDFPFILGLILLVTIGSILRFFPPRNRDPFPLVLIFSGILIPLLPAILGFWDFRSPFFWFCLMGGVGAGFIYARNYGIEMGQTPEAMYKANPLADGNTGSGQKGFYILAFLLIVFGLFLRLNHLGDLPKGYSYWELDRAYHAIKYDQGEKGIADLMGLFKIKGGQSSTSPLMMGLSLVFFKVFGINLLTSRIISVVLGFVGLWFLYLFFRNFCGRTASLFFLVFPTLEIFHVVFSRTGFNYISAFTYAAFILWLFYRIFQPGGTWVNLMRGGFLGVALYASIYMYYPARILVLFIFFVLLFYLFHSKGFFIKFKAQLISFLVVILGVTLLHTGGNILDLWPNYPGYVNPKEKETVGDFVLDSKNIISSNILPVIERTAFNKRAVDSTSHFASGGLISGPALAFIPFGLGVIARRLRHPVHLLLALAIILTLIPAILSGIPNSRRLLLFFTFFSIAGGITLYFLIVQIKPLISINKAILISGICLYMFFSYSLYIFWDVNQKLKPQRTVHMPFAESGLGDISFSLFKTKLAYHVRDLLETGDVYLFYSFVFDEPGFGPNGTFEQMLIEGYPKIKKGKKLVWLNRYYEGFQAHGGRYFEKNFFSEFRDIRRLVTSRRGPVHFIFVKPLADELDYLYRLEKEYSGVSVSGGKGTSEWEEYFILSVPAPEARVNLKKDRVQIPKSGLENGIQRRLEFNRPYPTVNSQFYVHPYSANGFHFKNPDNYLYYLYGNVFDQSGKQVTPDDRRIVVKILEGTDRFFVFRGDENLFGDLSVYDREWNPLIEIPLHGYPFDAFWGPDDEIYITYLQYNGIGIYLSDGTLGLWETGDLSKLPFWNGFYDGKGEFTLISAGRELFKLDKKRNLLHSFPVDISWWIYAHGLRDRGGFVVEDDLIHVLNPYKNEINTYSKNGERLLSPEGESLFGVPEEFQVSFLEKNHKSVYLISRGQDRRILEFNVSDNESG